MSHIIIDIKVPIYEEKQKILKIFRIPFIKRGERNIMIRKDKDFIVNNTNNYLTFSEQELKKCNTLLNNNLVCDVEHDNVNRRSCEGEILRHKNDSVCKFSTFKPHSHLLHIENGTFYVVVYEPLTIEITHKNGTKEKQTFKRDSWIKVDTRSSILMEKQRIIIRNETKDCNSEISSSIKDLSNFTLNEATTKAITINTYEKHKENIANIVKFNNLISLEVFWIAVATVVSFLIIISIFVYCLWKSVCCC